MTTATADLTIEDLKDRIGQEVGISSWFLVDQKRIDTFADVTEDWQFIHVDQEAAAKTPFGTTIAHGFLTLSLLAPMAYSGLPGIAGRVMGVNYGFDKIRFMSPVPSGSRVRARFTLKEVNEKGEKQYLLRHEVAVEIEGKEKPALVADWLGMSYFA